MKNELQETTTEFYEWLQKRREKLPISALFWNIQPIEKVNKIQLVSPKINLKRHGAEMMKTTPFYKLYSKIVILR